MRAAWSSASTVVRDMLFEQSLAEVSRRLASKQYTHLDAEECKACKCITMDDIQMLLCLTEWAVHATIFFNRLSLTDSCVLTAKMGSTNSLSKRMGLTHSHLCQTRIGSPTDMCRVLEIA